ncbi:MAG: L-2-amino-thiazoline-4-carboxylic acid hydrolase [Chloroflexota bacterium]|nr:L-2-amino-thiazoline-4-carboxylic acid hydrolase [Candidatus Sulfotelmatobacter sp.]
MGLRLLILNWWTPKYIIRKELKNISDKSNTALRSLVSKYAKKAVDPTNMKQQSSKNIEAQRTLMAQTQAKLVDMLATAVGNEEAIKLGREALFLVGQNLGKQTRSRLGVNNNPEDLTKAAKILYRILGIEFHLDWHDPSNATLVIDRCALAEEYSRLTCEILSATDEGVINGLQPKVTMKFREYMTSGYKNCRANICLSEKEDED